MLPQDLESRLALPKLGCVKIGNYQHCVAPEALLKSLHFSYPIVMPTKAKVMDLTYDMGDDEEPGISKTTSSRSE